MTKPPDVWAVFLLHHAEGGSVNWRKQAITLIDTGGGPEGSVLPRAGAGSIGVAAGSAGA